MRNQLFLEGFGFLIILLGTIIFIPNFIQSLNKHREYKQIIEQTDDYIPYYAWTDGKIFNFYLIVLIFSWNFIICWVNQKCIHKKLNTLHRKSNDNIQQIRRYKQLPFSRPIIQSHSDNTLGPNSNGITGNHRKFLAIFKRNNKRQRFRNKRQIGNISPIFKIFDALRSFDIP